MLEIGNIQFGIYGTNYPDATNAQKDPRLQWNVVVKVSHLQYIAPGTHIILEEVGNYSGVYGDFTNLAWIQSRFDLATAQKDRYEYAAYLMYEELFHPQVRAQWGLNPLSTWKTTGSMTISGETLELIKTYYLRVNGSFDDAAWATMTASNNWDNAFVRKWSLEYALKLHRAWVTHIRSIGKKTAIIGACGTAGWDQIDFIYPSNLRAYILQNFDLLYIQTLPSSIALVQKSTVMAANLRAEGYNGIILHGLTSKWGTSMGTDDPTIQYAEFVGVAPYVDVIAVFPYIDMRVYPGSGLYPPRLISFFDTYIPPCPASECNFTITQ